jgi:CheY-like chemotaxis protein
VVGRGTNVTIWLPETADEHAPPESPPQLATPVAAAIRVLVAEDQPEVRLLIKRVLDRAGYTVLLAADGNEALHLAQSAPASALVLVTDYDMPGLRGDELALALRAQWPALPVVLMSGFTSEGWPTELASAPGVALIEKPFSPDSLLQAVLAVRQQTADATAAVEA